MQDCKPIDTPIAKDEGLSLKMYPKTPQKKKNKWQRFLTLVL